MSVTEYPTTQCSPILAHMLYQASEGLEMRWKNANLSPDFASRQIAGTLRLLYRQGVNLTPRSATEEANLAKRGRQAFYFVFHRNAKRDYVRQNRSPASPLCNGSEDASPETPQVAQRAHVHIVSTEDLAEGDGWQPTTTLYGAGTSLSPDPALWPGDDLLGGETGRLLVERLQSRYGLARVNALAIVLDTILPSFRIVGDVLREMGYTNVSLSYLRKTARSRMHRDKLRAILIEAGMTPPVCHEGHPKDSIPITG